MSNFELWRRVEQGSKIFIRIVPGEETEIVGRARILPPDEANRVVDLPANVWVEILIDQAGASTIRVAVFFPLRTGTATIHAFVQNLDGSVKEKKYAHGVAPTEADLVGRSTLVLLAMEGE